MRKSLILAALVLISAGCFAQKNASIKKAKSMLNSEKPDFAAAHVLAAQGLAEEPTAENYYWAAFIDNKLVQNELYKESSHEGEYNISEAGPAATSALEYLLKADELALVLVPNKKGVEVPTDPKMRGKVAKMILEFFKNKDFVRYGALLSEQNDFAGAYAAFNTHIGIPEMEVMQDPKIQKELVLDTMYYKYMLNASYFAMRAEMHHEAVQMLLRLKNYGQIEPLLVNQFLCEEYLADKDSANYVKALQEGVMLFPQEDFFIQNLVSYSVQTNTEANAVAFFTEQIESHQTEPLFYVKRGLLYELLENADASMADFDKAIELDPKCADAIGGKGRLIYNKGVKMYDAAQNIVDNREYNKEIEKVSEVIRQALPFFEQAHELAPTRASFVQALKEIYFRFRSEPGMQAKYDEMVEILNNL